MMLLSEWLEGVVKTVNVLFVASQKALIKTNVELEELRETFIERVETAVQEAREYNDSMERFAYLWTDDREASLKNFLNQENIKSDDLHSTPSLEKFKKKIDEYEAIYSEVWQRIWRF